MPELTSEIEVGRGTELRRVTIERGDVWRTLIGSAVLAALYYGSARLGYELNFAGPVAAIIWLPVGVAISFLYLGGLQFLPGVLVGDLLANDYSTLPLGTAMLQTLGNLLEVVIAVAVLRRLVRRGSPLDRAAGVGAMLLAIALGVTVSATTGSLALLPTDIASLGDLPRIWRTWWLGDATGALVVLPFAIAWYRPLPERLSRPQWIEAGVLLAVTAGLSEVALRSEEPLVYLMFPALIWAALRFGRRGATLAIAVVVGLTVWNTTHYAGPFVFDSVTRSVLNTQLFIAVAAVTTLLLSAIMAERMQFADGLAASRARIVGAADTERRRLERNLHDGAQQRLIALAYRLHDATLAADGARDGTRKLLEESEEQLQLAIDELRELAHGIHPAMLTTLGLGNAIHGLTERASIPVTVVHLSEERVDAAAESTAYYVVAEALANAQRHSHATSVRVWAIVSPGLLRVEVDDNGVGGAAEELGSGLQGLRDRVEALGGSFRVISIPGLGTRIGAEIPATALA